jgi:hypothetical protein
MCRGLSLGGSDVVIFERAIGVLTYLQSRYVFFACLPGIVRFFCRV